MREFMDHVHAAFYEATGWSRDNSYAALNAIPDALVNFQTPRGLRLTLSSLASANFATSYQLGSVGAVDGFIAYLYSSVALRDVHLTPRSDTVSLPRILRSYRPLAPLPAAPRASHGSEVTSRRDIDKATASAASAATAASLLCGRLYLPLSQLEALAVRRVSPALQLQLSAVSGQHLRDGGTVVGLAQYSSAKGAVEGLASSDGGLLGLRAVYNFGSDVGVGDGAGDLTMDLDHAAAVTAAAAAAAATATTTAVNNGGGGGGAVTAADEREPIYGRFSTGAELYYGTLNKSGGVSLGGRFATLPSYRGTPLSATLTLNPLMGNIAASYAVVAGRHCSLATRIEFNVFSYESAWAVGMELWRRPFRRRVVDEDDDDGDDDDDDHNDDGNDMTGVGFCGVRGFYKDERRRRRAGERSWQAKLEWRVDEESGGSSSSDSNDNSDGSGNDSTGSVAERASAAWTATHQNTLSNIPVNINNIMNHINNKNDNVNANKVNSESESESEQENDEYAGVLKARLDQELRVGLLWEGRVKSLLFSLGSGIDLRRMDKPFLTLGLEIQFWS